MTLLAWVWWGAEWGGGGTGFILGETFNGRIKGGKRLEELYALVVVGLDITGGGGGMTGDLDLLCCDIHSCDDLGDEFGRLEWSEFLLGEIDDSRFLLVFNKSETEV